LRNAEKKKYVKWYRLAEKALDDLVPHPKSESAITKWVSKENWLMIPTFAERTIIEARNRPDPNIYFALGNERISLGLICNTLASVEKMRNLLHNYHAKERTDFLSHMKGLDNAFRIKVNVKKKPHHYAQPPTYETDYEMQANKVDDESISEIFRRVDNIRDKGIQEREIEDKSWPPTTPGLDIASKEVPYAEQDFLDAMTELRPLYDVCLRIKTGAEIERELRKLQKQKVTIMICSRCHSSPEPSFTGKFCPKCHTFLLPTQVSKDKLAAEPKPS